MDNRIFSIQRNSSECSARTGNLVLPHGEIKTPVFMPVGTNGTVKAMRSADLSEIGFKIILSNTYHLYLRPGTEIIGQAGGLHRWMNWNDNILTDSGGFQVFSLTSFRKIHEDGIAFRSHIDGSYHLLSPEKVVNIQAILGSDIQMQLDVCTGWNIEYKQAKEALILTTDWLNRAKKTWEKCSEYYKGKLFGIVQGNFFKELRKISADSVIAAELPGIAIGGLSVGEPFSQFQEILGYTASLLPIDIPRYVMGIGTPEFIFEAVENGIDMFDCVFPTRTARNGLAFTNHGPLSIKKENNKSNFLPLDPQCSCNVCRQYSRSYIRHLYKTGEILASMLITYHNLFFLNKLIDNIRQAICEDRFLKLKKDFLTLYGDRSNEQPSN